MALSVGLTQAGNPPESLATEAKVTVAQVEGGFGITKIELSVTGKVPGLDADGFAAAAQGAKEGCPLSKALAAVPEITLGDELRGLASVGEYAHRRRAVAYRSRGCGRCRPRPPS